jgi:hypothetical protein
MSIFAEKLASWARDAMHAGRLARNFCRYRWYNRPISPGSQAVLRFRASATIFESRSS